MFLLNPAAQSRGGNNTPLYHVGVLLCACPSGPVCVCQATYMMVHTRQLGEQICGEAASQRVGKLVLWAPCA